MKKVNKDKYADKAYRLLLRRNTANLYVSIKTHQQVPTYYGSMKKKESIDLLDMQEIKNLHSRMSKMEMQY